MIRFVTVQIKRWAEVRLPQLAKTPASVRFVSCEPLLGPVDLRRWLGCGLDWVIVGGESGHGARPMHPGWARDIRDHCLAAQVPFFFKLLCTFSRSRSPEHCCQSRGGVCRGEPDA